MKRLKAFFKRLVPLRSTQVDPRVFLEELLENAHNYKSVMVVLRYHDDTYDCDWSKMEAKELAMACIVLDEQLRRCIIDRGRP